MRNSENISHIALSTVRKQLLMTTIASMRFSKTIWLNFHRRHCSSLITNRFNAIIMGDSIAAGLDRSVCTEVFVRSTWIL